MTCPCGAGAYAACCEPLHDGVRQARTAEELMRSRYSAYAVGNVNYIFRTWHPRTRPEAIEPDDVEWVGLQILEAQDGGEQDAEGVVEFVARYTLDGRVGEMRERSRFARRGARWVYVDAI